MEGVKHLSPSDLESCQKICRSFYIKAILQLQQRFDFSPDFYSILQMLIPQNVRDRNPQTLAAVFSRFPALHNSCDSSKAEIEWRSLSVMPLKELGLQTEDDLKILSAEAFWLLVFNLKCSTGCRFPNLSVVVSYLFSLPYSNAIAERLFSFLKLTKTDHRGALKEDTILGLMRMKYFMKNTDTKSYSVQFPDELVQRVLKVRANKTLGDTTSQPTGADER